MDDVQKRRVSIFITGVLIGSVLSMVLFYLWQTTYEKAPQQTADVVVATCEIEAGEVLTEACTTIRTGVAVHFLPPDVMLAKDLSMYTGRKVTVAIEKGNALRTADIEAVE